MHSDPAAPTALARWGVQMPELNGSVALVTGASDGVGFEIARALARAGAEVVMPVRNRAKGEGAAERIRESAPGSIVELRDLDLASFASVDGLVRTLETEGRPIDLFVANAGIVLLGDPMRHVSADGYELHFQTNFLGHAALTAGILPLLRAGDARVVLQCSLAANHFGIDLDDLQSERRYSALRAYASSKIALGLFGVELHRRCMLARWGLRVALSHPGIALTNIGPPALRNGTQWWNRAARALMERGALGQSAAEAASTALYALTAPDAVGGGLYGPSRPLHLSGPPRQQRVYRNLADSETAERLWAIMDSQLPTRFPVTADG
ncbi:SDR family oxidoreductase [Microbacterium pumilum]|uniref:SDR family oxidoreductase n=1 Tax=Microbacterium pumilum TaxID=344165 RepID=A0ABP5DGF6_9MICO